MVKLNGKWVLNLPTHRAIRPEWATGWERERLDSMHKRLVDGDVVYDIGAEEGDMSALYASWGCKVVLVEPNPVVWPCTKASFALNDLTPAACFVGMVADDNDRDEGTVLVDGWPECADGKIVTAHGFSQYGTDAAPTTTIDKLTERTGLVPDAITIDVEGAELHVLRGATHTLRYARPKVWCSVHPEDMITRYGHGMVDLFALMEAFGYRYELLAYDHELHVCWTA